jgi:hypothetical protein
MCCLQALLTLYKLLQRRNDLKALFYPSKSLYIKLCFQLNTIYHFIRQNVQTLGYFRFVIYKCNKVIISHEKVRNIYVVDLTFHFIIWYVLMKHIKRQSGITQAYMYIGETWAVSAITGKCIWFAFVKNN